MFTPALATTTSTVVEVLQHLLADLIDRVRTPHVELIGTAPGVRPHGPRLGHHLGGPLVAFQIGERHIVAFTNGLQERWLRRCPASHR